MNMKISSLKFKMMEIKIIYCSIRSSCNQLIIFRNFLKIFVLHKRMQTLPKALEIDYENNLL